ncbi:hypothetical protein Q5794_05980 [Priestia megaterium]|uniref:hypothetical protein n=1 Tax=Priestia megaterium TaxID=1404 RepID=UPI0035BE33C7
MFQFKDEGEINGIRGNVDVMKGNFCSFLKSAGINAELNLHAISNPDAEITALGLVLVKVKQYLSENNWWYKTK